MHYVPGTMLKTTDGKRLKANREKHLVCSNIGWETEEKI